MAGVFFLVILGFMGGEAAQALRPRAQAVPALRAFGGDSRGCCYMSQGPIVPAVTEEYCRRVLGGVRWDYGECGTGAPLGCCLDEFGFLHPWVSEKRCFVDLDGMAWYEGLCP